MKMGMFIALLIVLFLFTQTNGSFSTKNIISQKMSRRTPVNDAGLGHVIFLDRHNVECPLGSALSGFHLLRPSLNQIHYEFDCRQSPAISSTVDQRLQTNRNVVGWQWSSLLAQNHLLLATQFLDRHPVMCPLGMALRRFLLIRPSAYELAYDYSCSLMFYKRCYDKTTPRVEGSPQNFYLDKLTIETQPNEVLRGFKLHSDYRNGMQFNYQYTVCEIDQQRTQNFPYTTRLNEYGKGIVFYLDRHYVSCPTGHALKGFQFRKPVPDGILIGYNCKQSDELQLPVVTYYTEWRPTGDYTTQALDNHNVNCPWDSVMIGYGLRRKDMNIRYEYQCQKAYIKKCRTDQTKSVRATGLTDTLERHEILLSGNEVLQGFQLVTKYKDVKNEIQTNEQKGTKSDIVSNFFGTMYWHYQYTVCELDEGKNKREQTRLVELRFAKIEEEYVKRMHGEYRRQTWNSKTQSVSDTSMNEFSKLEVKCKDGSAIQGIHLTRPTSDTVAYEYNCRQSKLIKKGSKQKFTPFRPLTPNQQTRAIALHDVKCGLGEGLTHFRFLIENGQGRYVYSCAKIDAENCQKAETPLQFAANGQQVIYLDRHFFNEKDNKIITGFKLIPFEEASRLFYKYEYTFCELPEKARSEEARKKWLIAEKKRREFDKKERETYKNELTKLEEAKKREESKMKSLFEDKKNKCSKVVPLSIPLKYEPPTAKIEGKILDVLTNNDPKQAVFSKSYLRILYIPKDAKKIYEAEINKKDSSYSITLPKGEYIEKVVGTGISEISRNVKIKKNRPYSIKTLVFVSPIKRGWRIILEWEKSQIELVPYAYYGKERLSPDRRRSNDHIVSVDTDPKKRNDFKAGTITVRNRAPNAGLVSYYIQKVAGKKVEKKDEKKDEKKEEKIEEKKDEKLLITTAGARVKIFKDNQLFKEVKINQKDVPESVTAWHLLDIDLGKNTLVMKNLGLESLPK